MGLKSFWGLTFFYESCDGTALLCVVVVPLERSRLVRQGIYLGRSCHVLGGVNECTLFQLHYFYTSESRSVVLCGSVCGVTIGILQAPSVKYSYSFIGKRDRNHP